MFTGRSHQVANTDQLHRLRCVADNLGVVELDALVATKRMPVIPEQGDIALVNAQFDAHTLHR